MATSITTSNSTSADNEEGPSRPAKTARRTSVANLTNRFESRGAKSSILTELSQTTMRVNSPPRRKKALPDQEFAPEAQLSMSTEDVRFYVSPGGFCARAPNLKFKQLGEMFIAFTRVSRSHFQNLIQL
ncbi:hypothetical protein GPALN_016379 [Globodera pallida]|nr:hypothetical protein GPALN_016379 [Globodera pallida]